MAFLSPLTAGLILGGLMLLSAFFSMSETAVIRANRVLIRSMKLEGKRGAHRLDHMLQHPERILGTILVGNNLVNIAAASLATFLAVEFFGPKGTIYATIVVTTVILLFAEITPKTLAVRHPTETALRSSLPLRVFELILLPFSVLMNGIARLILRLLGIKGGPTVAAVTVQDIEAMVRVGAEEGEVEDFEQQVIEDLFEFTETPVRDVMTPANQVVFINKDKRMSEGLELVGESGHSRIIVVEGDFSEVLGFFHAKDLLKFTDQRLRELPVSASLRGVLFVRDDTDCHRVLARMQKTHKLLAVIQDREGENVGIASVEDLLEEIVGEINDEFDDDDEEPDRADDGSIGYDDEPRRESNIDS